MATYNDENDQGYQAYLEKLWLSNDGSESFVDESFVTDAVKSILDARAAGGITAEQKAWENLQLDRADDVDAGMTFKLLSLTIPKAFPSMDDNEIDSYICNKVEAELQAAAYYCDVPDVDGAIVAAIADLFLAGVPLARVHKQSELHGTPSLILPAYWELLEREPDYPGIELGICETCHRVKTCALIIGDNGHLRQRSLEDMPEDCPFRVERVVLEQSTSDEDVDALPLHGGNGGAK